MKRIVTVYQQVHERVLRVAPVAQHDLLECPLKLRHRFHRAVFVRAELPYEKKGLAIDVGRDAPGRFVCNAKLEIPSAQAAVHAADRADKGTSNLLLIGCDQIALARVAVEHEAAVWRIGHAQAGTNLGGDRFGRAPRSAIRLQLGGVDPGLVLKESVYGRAGAARISCPRRDKARGLSTEQWVQGPAAGGCLVARGGTDLLT